MNEVLNTIIKAVQELKNFFEKEIKQHLQENAVYDFMKY